MQYIKFEEITLQDVLETFVLEDGIWKNERNGDMSIVLSECTGGYAVKDAIEQKTYFYNTDGQITSIEDACRNRTVFEYQAGVLSRMSLAGGQYLDFEFEDNKLRRITDIQENRFAFTGEQYDPVSQLYYLRARF